MRCLSFRSLAERKRSEALKLQARQALAPVPIAEISDFLNLWQPAESRRDDPAMAAVCWDEQGDHGTFFKIATALLHACAEKDLKTSLRMQEVLESLVQLEAVRSAQVEGFEGGLLGFLQGKPGRAWFADQEEVNRFVQRVLHHRIGYKDEVLLLFFF